MLIEIAQLALEIAWIVVREDAGFAAAVADTLDHQGVVEFADRIVHPGMREAACMIVIGAGNIASAAGAGPATF